MTHFAIVGAGQAGAALAAKLRAEGFDGRISLIGEETHAPYQRPPLSKAYLTGKLSRERLFLRPLRFYEEQDINLRTDCRVTSMDAKSRTLTFENGETLPCDAIALTTGSTAIPWPAASGGELSGVHLMRGMHDADGLAPDLVEGRRMLVIGGGYIGLEAAAVAAQAELKVTLVEAAPRILNRVASSKTAAWFRDLHARHGVRILEGRLVQSLKGSDGHVIGATLDDGRELDVDAVVVGIGIRPSITLAAKAGLTCDNGIVVDRRGRTSAEGIYAAGDCASFPHGSSRLRLESVPHAIAHAENVALNMLGKGTDYRASPWFWSDQYDIKLQIAGLYAGGEQVICRPGDRPGSISHWYFDGCKLTAVDSMNDPKAHMVAKRILEDRLPITPERVADTSAPVKSLLQCPVSAKVD